MSSAPLVIPAKALGELFIWADGTIDGNGADLRLKQLPDGGLAVAQGERQVYVTPLGKITGGLAEGERP